MRELLRDRTAIQLALVALLLNLVGSWWGVPHMTNASAPPHGWEMDTTAGLGTLSELHNLFYPKPDWYVAYPLLHYLAQGAAYAPYLLFLLLTGQVQNPTGTFPYGLQNPAVPVAVAGGRRWRMGGYRAFHADGAGDLRRDHAAELERDGETLSEVDEPI